MNPPRLNFQFLAISLICVTVSLFPRSRADGQTVNANVVNITNPGATVWLKVDDQSNGVNPEFSIFHNTSLFEINSAQPSAFSIHSLAKSDTLTLRGAGIGIGTRTPAAELHVLGGGGGSPFSESTVLIENTGIGQDRTLLDLRNNGAAVISLLDTTDSTATPYTIRGDNQRLSIQKTGGATQAGMTIFADGNIRYSINGIPNITVKPNGNMNIIGQTGGGNVNILGPTGGTPGNLFVKGNISYNGTLSGPSDRNLKENFAAVDPAEILEKVVGLPISRWNYKSDQQDTPHIGPMAQDFIAAFQVGDNDRRIPLMDSDGVALAAIQGLFREGKDREQEIERLRKTVSQQNETIDALLSRLQKIESALGSNLDR